MKRAKGIAKRLLGERKVHRQNVDATDSLTSTLPVESPTLLPNPTHEDTTKDHTTQKNTTPTSIPPQNDTAPNLQSLHQILWDQAYDELKDDEANVVISYEKILSTKLRNFDDPTSVLSEDGENEIASASEKRCQQMQQLVQDGIKRAEKQTEVKGHIDSGMQMIKSLKGIINKSIQAAPAAAVAWVGVSIGLEILANPTKQPALNRKGMTYILSRIDWYWNLADLLLDENKAHKSSLALQSSLRGHVLTLYKKLLLYQMHSVCLYYRSWAAVLLRDLVKLDDWEETLNGIKAVEALVKEDSEQYNTVEIRSALRGIEEATSTKLDDIYLALREGIKHQEDRDLKEQDKKCRQDLRLTNPQDDKKRIQISKGGLLRDSYCWILKHDSFKEFMDNPESRLLWIKGDPGKGKTMLLCGIIDELWKSTKPLSYFFCQATEKNLSNQVAALRGLIYLLVEQQPSLISLVREEYDKAGSKLFEDGNASVCLERILSKMLKDKRLEDTVLILDALDECTTNRDELVDLVMRLSESCRAKWIISSRNWPEIETRLKRARKVTVQLELNQNSISEAVTLYINKKVDDLASAKGYKKSLEDEVRGYLTSHADNTFLWVALVCKRLDECGGGEQKTRKTLKSSPPGLVPFYALMMGQIYMNEEADLIKRILATTCVAYRPLTFTEMKGLLQQLKEYDEEDMSATIESCGSFLTHLNGIIYFVHQSAKDFLLNESNNAIPPPEFHRQHGEIFLRSLDLLTPRLKRNIYGLPSPGCLVGEIKRPLDDPLGSIAYACNHWVNHFLDSKFRKASSTKYVEKMLNFFREKFLQWLEALCLLRSLPGGISSIVRLHLELNKTDFHDLTGFIRDARRFVLYHKVCIEMAPLQVYASALIFSPTQSLVRAQFHQEEPDWILQKPMMEENWDDCVQTLHNPNEGPELGSKIFDLVYSPDGRFLASSYRTGVDVWDATSGHYVQRLETGESPITVGFSKDGLEITVATRASLVRTWDWRSGVCKHSLGITIEDWCSSDISSDAKKLAFGDHKGITRTWDLDSGQCQVLVGHEDQVHAVTFSANAQYLATASGDGTAKVWNAVTGRCIQTLKGCPYWITSAAFSEDGKKLVTGLDYGAIKIWNWETGDCIQTLKANTRRVRTVPLLGGGFMITSVCTDESINIWDENGTLAKTLVGYSEHTYHLCVSPDGRLLASSSVDSIKIWDIADVSAQTSVSKANNGICSSASETKPRSNWGPCFKNNIGPAKYFAFSLHGKALVSHSSDDTVSLLHIETGTRTEFGKWKYVGLSRNGRLAKSNGSKGDEVCIWDLATNSQIQSIKLKFRIRRLCFSANGGFIAVHRERPLSVCVACRVYDLSKRIWVTEYPSGDYFDSTFTYSEHSASLVHHTVFQYEMQDFLEQARVMTFISMRECIDVSADRRWLAYESNTITGICVVNSDVHLWKDEADSDQTDYCLQATEDKNARLQTRYGDLDLSTPEARSQGAFAGYGISRQGDWIIRGTERLLWIPEEYRGVEMDVSTSQIALQNRLGRISLARLRRDDFHVST